MEVMFADAKRVLLPKGIMIITEVLPSTIRKGIWYSQLSLSLCERFCKLFPTTEQYIEMFEKYAFNCVTKFNALGTELVENHKDPEGPLKKDWRKGVSLFSFATEKEIHDIEQFVQEMNNDGTIFKYIKEHDRTLEMGFLTVFVCISS